MEESGKTMELDEFDLKILGELEDDARLSIQELSRKTGVKRTTLRYRVNKLISSGTLDFACIANIEALEYQIPICIGISVVPGRTEVVASEIASLPAVKVVNIVSGHYEIFAWALLKDHQELTQFISEDLGQIQGISAIETIIAFNWIRESWRYFNPKAETNITPDFEPSELDLTIIRTLQQFPRQSISSLALSSGCSKPVAKARLENLIKAGIIRLVSIVNPAALGYQIEAVIMAKSSPGRVFDLAKELSMKNFIRYVSLTTGNWQILAIAQFRDSAQMQDYLTNTLAAMPGVTDYTVTPVLKTVKFTMNLVGYMI
jgi:DNA-binding Lrp family transcriptional regulator